VGVSSYGIYVPAPSGVGDYSRYGFARIHGSNVAAANYSIEVVYHGDQPAQIGEVLALDGQNEESHGTPVLGVVRATARPAAAGVLSTRLTSANVDSMAKMVVDRGATTIQPGAHAYIVIAGTVRMKVANAAVGSRLALDDQGRIVPAAVGSSQAIGKVASAPNKDGTALVLVNLQ
jgi:hypothetical protein